MALHLEKVSLAIPPGHHALLVLDQAGWLTTVRLPRLPNVSLLLLLAGSPELNRAEQVWQQLRNHSLVNRCYESYEDIVVACCAVWNAFYPVSPAPSALCAPAAGHTCRFTLNLYDSELVSDMNRDVSLAGRVAG